MAVILQETDRAVVLTATTPADRVALTENVDGHWLSSSVVEVDQNRAGRIVHSLIAAGIEVE